MRKTQPFGKKPRCYGVIRTQCDSLKLVKRKLAVTTQPTSFRLTLILYSTTYFLSRSAAGVGKMGGGNRTRPMSASEAAAARSKEEETLFNMRQRHWEGLIAGKKTLHHGKLLPGSSTSDEDGAGKSTIKPPPTCWSEVSSPRKQVCLGIPYIYGLS